MKTRGFEIAKEFEQANINLPQRSTAHSAGYDFECAEDVEIPSIWQSENKKPTLVKTGVKAYMPNDEALFLYNRSGNPGKKGLVLANSVGVVDSDYYGNPDNDGHIMFAFYNFFPETVVLKKGERVGQGIFQKFLKVDYDAAEAHGAVQKAREGGFGSTSS